MKQYRRDYEELRRGEFVRAETGKKLESHKRVIRRSNRLSQIKA
jgi:hypothetical protein